MTVNIDIIDTSMSGRLRLPMCKFFSTYITIEFFLSCSEYFHTIEASEVLTAIVGLGDGELLLATYHTFLTLLIDIHVRI
jgi:hypothetical protein